MSYGDVKDCAPSFSYPDEKVSDERFGPSSSQSSPLLPQAIVFPYVGPPGSGPGLLGTRPGSGVTEFLIALEHHAASLKSALQVVQALKNKSDDSSSVEYDSPSDSPSDSPKEDKKSGSCAKVSSLTEHMPCAFRNGLETSSSIKQPSTLLDKSTTPVLSKQSSSDDSNSDFTINDLVEDFSYSSATNDQEVVDSCKVGAIKTNVINNGSYELADELTVESPVCLGKIGNQHDVECSADNLKSQRLVFCSRNHTDDCSCENTCENAAKKDVEESCAVLKKKALRAARNGLQQFRKLMVEREMSPQRKAIEGILLCLTSLCKEEELWNMKEDFLVSLEIPL